MSYISGLSSIEKGQRGELFFNKSQFLFATDFATDPYFEDELNWKRIALHFKDPTSNQRQIVILKDDGSRGWYAPSETCRTGIWEVEFIEIYDKQGDVFRVERNNMPTPGDFDIDVQRKVPPASLVSAVVEESELVSNGNFDTGTSFWTAGANATVSVVGGRFRIATNDGNGGGCFADQLVSTTPGKRYKTSYDTQVFQSGRESNMQILDPSVILNVVSPTSVAYHSSLVDEFTATTTNTTVRLTWNAIGAGNFAEFDNVSVREVPNKIALEEDEGLNWRVGFKCRIWDDVAGQYLTNDVYEITDIQGDQFTLDKQIIGDYEGKTLRLRFPEYNDASGVQASLYQYVSQGF